MKINEAVFSKYNPEEDVARCPYGRAKVRDILHDYAQAAVNLYGVISLEDMVELFNQQTEFETDVDELYIMLLPLVFKDKAYVFYKNNLAQYELATDFSSADNILKEQTGKERYVPAQEEFLDYMDPTHNNRRTWENKGHRPTDAYDAKAEVKQARSENESVTNLTEANSEEVIEISPPKKIGRNEPCPCGRGKKYKKCCLSYDVKQTAQLSADDRDLFFELYLSLLEYINKKVHLVNVEFNHENTEPNLSQLMFPVRQFLIQNPQVLTDFLEVTDLSADKKEILESWQGHYVEKNYMIVDYKNDYAVLLDISQGENANLYGVKGISHSVATAILRPLPTLVSTVVLPFKDQLIFDSFIGAQNLAYGPTIKQGIDETYQTIMDEKGIVSQLD